MSAAFAVSTIIEFIFAALLIYGFIHEERVIAFEQSIKRIVIGNIRRYIRIKNHKKTVARGEHLRVVPKKEKNSSSVVA